VLGSSDVTWKAIFQADGKTYQPPRIVIFQGGTRSACGFAQSAMGPFYCPPSKEIYLDTAFFNELERRFRGCTGKACEFAQAYVIAHEVGHHVQNLLGILPKAQRAQQATGNKVESNRIQVRVELQADCLAGVWANHADKKWKLIEQGDVDAALQTATAIGDDMLQRQSQGRVVPDSFTHGSSEQRKRWFSVGLKEGRVSACNTFSAGQV
jgi:predicted metalloprotease